MRRGYVDLLEICRCATRFNFLSHQSQSGQNQANTLIERQPEPLSQSDSICTTHFMGNISRKFSRIFQSSRQTISRCWQEFLSRPHFAEEDSIQPASSLESFGDGTRMLEILYAHTEPGRMTIALSVRENALFELVSNQALVSAGKEFSALESRSKNHVTRFEIEPQNQRL